MRAQVSSSGRVQMDFSAPDRACLEKARGKPHCKGDTYYEVRVPDMALCWRSVDCRGAVSSHGQNWGLDGISEFAQMSTQR